jgi:hypothetical protein
MPGTGQRSRPPDPYQIRPRTPSLWPRPWVVQFGVWSVQISAYVQDLPVRSIAIQIMQLLRWLVELACFPGQARWHWTRLSHDAGRALPRLEVPGIHLPWAIRGLSLGWPNQGPWPGLSNPKGSGAGCAVVHNSRAGRAASQGLLGGGEARPPWNSESNIACRASPSWADLLGRALLRLSDGESDGQTKHPGGRSRPLPFSFSAFPCRLSLLPLMKLSHRTSMTFCCSEAEPAALPGAVLLCLICAMGAPWHKKTRALRFLILSPSPELRPAPDGR